MTDPQPVKKLDLSDQDKVSFQDVQEHHQQTFDVLVEIGRESGADIKQPLMITTEEQDILILDRPIPTRFRLRRFSGTGAMQEGEAIFQRGNGDTELLEPAALVSTQGGLHIVDAGTNSVKKFTHDGRWLDTYSTVGASGDSLDGPRDVSVDGAGNMYIADTNNNRIVQLQPDGELGWILETFTEGAPGTSVSQQAKVPGAASGSTLPPRDQDEEDELYEPLSVCATPNQDFWVADTNQNRVLLFSANRQVRTVLGEEDLFSFPSRVRGQNGTLYVADQGNRRVQRFGLAEGEAGRTFTRTGTLLVAAPLVTGGHMDVDAQGQIVMVDPHRECVVVLGMKRA